MLRALQGPGEGGWPWTCLPLPPLPSAALVQGRRVGSRTNDSPSLLSGSVAERFVPVCLGGSHGVRSSAGQDSPWPRGSGRGVQPMPGDVESWKKTEKGARTEAELHCPAPLTVAVPPGHIPGPLCASVTPSAPFLIRGRGPSRKPPPLLLREDGDSKEDKGHQDSMGARVARPLSGEDTSAEAAPWGCGLEPRIPEKGPRTHPG